MRMNGVVSSLHLDPLLPDSWLAGIVLAALMVIVLAAWKNRRGLSLRIMAVAALMGALLNPSLVEENRKAVKDVAVIVTDHSPSQNMGKRAARTEAARDYLRRNLGHEASLEIRTVEAPESGGLANETRLFDALERAVADIPVQQRAGVIVLTDGRVHDVPQNPALYAQYGPVSALLSGEKNEKDRQIVILNAPGYGIVGQTVTLKYKIEDTPRPGDALAALTISTPDGPEVMHAVPVNTEQTLELPVAHAGQNVYEFSVDPVPGEITDSNNKAAIIINGVRDRLRVLLVSGQPHAGGRTWRDLLTSDPGVDLIHFTILRDPNKLDATPQNELSLIAFPVPELFEIKLYDFDLIIFDRYHLNRILPDRYFSNIARYVEEGGALLEASGPSYATENSIYFTGLMNILPGIPTGEIIREPFTPVVTETGRHHPVTADLEGADISDPDWGKWLRQVGINPESGDVLMDGADNKPLLLLDRVGKGRVAQLASDQIWLWARGYDGGGPHAELLRRVVHWLMKEPELDEKALDVSVDGNKISIRSRDYKNRSPQVAITKPDGTHEVLDLEKSTDGVLSRVMTADQIGIYRFESADGQKRFAAVGALSPPELRGVTTTPEALQPLVSASGGGILWLADDAEPSVRYTAGTNRFSGPGWIGLRRNNDYTVTGAQDRPLLPAWVICLLLLALMATAWMREGRS